MKNFFLTSAVILFPLLLNAQSLPNKQEKGIALPANTRIDGQATEWADSYQAYNPTIEVNYTIANNDSVLYLIIHAKQTRIIQKILEGGVSFTVAKNKKGPAKNDISILFPLLSLPDAWKVISEAGMELAGYKKWTLPDEPPEGISGNKRVDSVVNSRPRADANRQLVSYLKEIKVSGIPEITDTIAGITRKSEYYRTLPLRDHKFQWIAIYNQYNIQALVQFNKNNELIYELAIPIKYVAGSIQNDKLEYKITIHGRSEDDRPYNVYNNDLSNGFAGRKLMDQDLQFPTYFSGQYVLKR